MAIWQDLVDQHGFAGGYQSVKRFVRKLRGVQSPEACAVILPKVITLMALVARHSQLA
jgi:hypothetical protein